MSGSYYQLNAKYNQLLALLQAHLLAGDLDAVLTAGNSAGGQSITGVNDIGLTTINGAAYPPLGTDILDDNTDATFFPVFSSGTGTQSLLVNNGTNPITINPNTGQLVVDTTLLVEGGAAGTRVNIGNGVAGAGFGGTGAATVAIGERCGESLGGAACVAIGSLAGLSTQGANSVAVGDTAGSVSQGSSSVAVGQNAGAATQGRNAVAVGQNAGGGLQADRATAVGNECGAANQGIDCVAVGHQAGNGRQGTGSVAIGVSAGFDRQGRNSIAIGNSAGLTLQNDNTIVLNATGAAINGDIGVSRFLVAPMRGVALGVGVGICVYDPLTFEMVYSTT